MSLHHSYFWEEYVFTMVQLRTVMPWLMMIHGLYFEIISFIEHWTCMYFRYLCILFECLLCWMWHAALHKNLYLKIYVYKIEDNIIIKNNVHVRNCGATIPKLLIVWKKIFYYQWTKWNWICVNLRFLIIIFGIAVPIIWYFSFKWQ